MMRNMGYLSMNTDQIGEGLMQSDLSEIGIAANKLANHAIIIWIALRFAITFFKFLASLAAIYLLILDRTNWRSNMLTSLLIPYIFLSLPSVVFSLFREEVGKWIGFVAVVLRLFFPQQFPDWLEMPSWLILLLVAAPGFLAGAVRDGIIGAIVCLVIACYLLQEHIRASGGFRNAFTQQKGWSNSLGIVLIMIYPVYRLATSL